MLEKLRIQLRHESQVADGTSQSRVSMYGLGGIRYGIRPCRHGSQEMLTWKRKTQIALAHIYWLWQTHPQVSVFWVHGGTAERFREAYARIAERCRVPGRKHPSSNVLSLVKRWLESEDRGRWLMVIDSADDAQLFSGPRTLGHWVPDCTHGSVLVTTRDKAAASRLSPGGHIIEVGKMDAGESIQLLQGKIGPDDVGVAGGLASLASRLEHIPLALDHAAATIQDMGITVGKYLELLSMSDRTLVDLLSEKFEFKGVDSDPEPPHAVVESWILSFWQIQQQDSLAGDLMSLMSFFDSQAIPLEFLTSYNKHLQKPESPERKILMVRALGILKAFSLITQGDIPQGRGNLFDMPRLVQLVVRKWLERQGTMHRFLEDALVVVSQNYPLGRYETQAACSALLHHADVVLNLEGAGSRGERLAKQKILHHVAVHFNYRGQWEKAAKYLTEATRIQKELLGDEHIFTLDSMSELASANRSLGRWKAAEEILVKNISMRSRILHKHHPDTLCDMVTLIATYMDQGRPKVAEELRVKVEDAAKQDGRAYPEMFAMMYMNLCQWKEVEKWDSKAMEMKKSVIGEEHPETLNSVYRLGIAYQHLYKVDLAGELALQALEGRKKLLGEEHPDTLASMDCLAGIRKIQDRSDEALDLMRRCVELRRRILGEKHPHTLASISTLQEWEAKGGLPGEAASSKEGTPVIAGRGDRLGGKR